MRTARAAPWALRVLGGLALTLGALGVAFEPEHAFAADASPITSAELDVQTVSECTSRADVISRVGARSPRIRFTRNPAPFNVRVQFTAPSPGAVTAEVTIARAGTKATTRSVSAASCADAADAVAIIIGVSLDPTSADSAASASAPNAPPIPQAEPASEAENNAAPATSASATRTNKRAAGEPNRPAKAPPNELARSFDPEDSLPSEPIELGLAAFVLGQGFVGPAPALLPAIRLYGRLQFERPGELAPSFGLGLTHAQRSDLVEWGGTAAFTLDAVDLDVCPLRFAFGSVALRSCASTLLGRLNVKGSDTRNPVEPVARVFATLGGAALLDVALGPVFIATAHLSAEGNLVRDEFQFYPRTFHRVPAATFALGVGIGVSSD